VGVYLFKYGLARSGRLLFSTFIPIPVKSALNNDRILGMETFPRFYVRDYKRELRSVPAGVDNLDKATR
jgi:hypothetical protein